MLRYTFKQATIIRNIQYNTNSLKYLFRDIRDYDSRLLGRNHSKYVLCIPMFCKLSRHVTKSFERFSIFIFTNLLPTSHPLRLLNKYTNIKHVITAMYLHRLNQINCVLLFIKWLSTIHLAYRFLLQCLEDLDSNLRKINSRLFVLRGQPNDIFPKIFEEWGKCDQFN